METELITQILSVAGKYGEVGSLAVLGYLIKMVLDNKKKSKLNALHIDENKIKVEENKVIIKHLQEELINSNNAHTETLLQLNKK